MFVKEWLIICFLIIAQYVTVFFNLYFPVVIASVIGVIPSYFLLQKRLKKTSSEKYSMEAYTRDIKMLGMYILLMMAVFLLLFIQDAMSFTSGFSVGLTLLVYYFLYLDFLRKKFSAHYEYNEVAQGMIKASMALLLFLLYQIVYYG